jgi:DNA polymerase-4
MGITVFRKREIDKHLWLLPIEKMHGVGKKTAPKLRSIGIDTIGDLANFRDFELLKETVGAAHAESLVYHARGGGSAEIDANNFTEAQSVSNSHTFTNPVYDEALLRKTFKVIANTVSYRLQKAGRKAQTIGIILKYPDLRQINRSRAIDNATNDAAVIYEVAEDIFTDYFNPGDQIRLIGIFAHRLSAVEEDVTQISIFDNFDKIEQEARIDDLVRHLKDKFGKNQINRGYLEAKNENA